MAGSQLALALALGTIVFASCGSDAEDATTGAARSEPKPAKVDLTRFLMQAGEEPGFRPLESPQVQSGVDALLMPGIDAERARQSGFISTAYQPIEAADRRSGGVTVVNLFQSEEKARSWMEYESGEVGIKAHTRGKTRRFAVPDVPGARGRTGLDSHGNRVGYVFWVQGRCTFLLGNEGDGPLAKPLSLGAKAIYDRTKGVCPA